MMPAVPTVLLNVVEHGGINPVPIPTSTESTPFILRKMELLYSRTTYLPGGMGLNGSISLWLQ